MSVVMQRPFLQYFGSAFTALSALPHYSFVHSSFLVIGSSLTSRNMMMKPERETIIPVLSNEATFPCCPSPQVCGFASHVYSAD